MELMANERQPAAIPKAFKHALDDVPKDTADWLEGKLPRAELTKADWRLMYDVLNYIKPLREGEERDWSRRKIEDDLGNRFARARHEVKRTDINLATTLVVERLIYEGLVVDDQYLPVDWDKRLDLGDFFRVRQGPEPFLRIYETLATLGEKAGIDNKDMEQIRMVISAYKVASSS